MNMEPLAAIATATCQIGVTVGHDEGERWGVGSAVEGLADVDEKSLRQQVGQDDLDLRNLQVDSVQP